MREFYMSTLYGILQKPLEFLGVLTNEKCMKHYLKTKCVKICCHQQYYIANTHTKSGEF